MKGKRKILVLAGILTTVLFFLIPGRNVLAAEKTDEQYTSDYVYDFMSGPEKQLYDALDMKCRSYLTGFADARTMDAYGYYGYPGYYLGQVSCSGLTRDEAASVVYIFINENPQYYFVEASALIGRNTLWLECYPEMASGTSRQQTTARFFAAADQYLAEIRQEKDAYRREKKAHDLLARNVSYRENNYDQSAYGALVREEAVCAGYAKAFTLLCNAAGVETITVDSSDHAWNMVSLGGKWYETDVTWDDDDDTGKIYEEFLNVSAATLSSRSGWLSASHRESAYWKGRLPAAPDNFRSGSYTFYPHWEYRNGVYYYKDEKGLRIQNCWKLVNGVWYWFHPAGEMAAGEWVQGCWLSADGGWTYAPAGSWQYGTGGWWYGDSSGWYARNQWEKINGSWYWFDEKGYIAASEYRNGYWLTADGSWDEGPLGVWQYDSFGGWWYGDSSGWYARNQWEKINGSWYWFNVAGYLGGTY